MSACIHAYTHTCMPDSRSQKREPGFGSELYSKASKGDNIFVCLQSARHSAKYDTCIIYLILMMTL